MKFMVSILLGLNLLVQGTVLPASSCFIPNVTIPLSPAAQTDTAPAADLNVMSEFLVMAATLLDIKSKMLLPAKESEDEEEEDPRAELVQQLLEYKMYKCMSSYQKVTLPLSRFFQTSNGPDRSYPPVSL